MKKTLVKPTQKVNPQYLVNAYADETCSGTIGILNLICPYSGSLYGNGICSDLIGGY